MDTLLQVMVSLMMVSANATHFSTSTPGEYYEVSQVRYDTITNTTYSLFTRYRVFGQYSPTTQAYHFQVRTYTGKKTTGELVQDAKERSDSGITVINN